MRGNNILLLLFALGAIVAIASGLAQRSWPIVALGVVLLVVGLVVALRGRQSVR